MTGAPQPWFAERVPLGRSQARVSRLGLGTAPLAGLYAPVDDAQAAEALATAWEAGISYFDTAPHYGAGLAERRLGSFLGQQSASGDEFSISTKVGRLLVPGRCEDGTDGFYGAPPDVVRVHDYTPEGVYRSLAESLERSGLDSFGILLIHDPDDHWEESVKGAYPALARLRDEGAVQAIGAGMNQTRMLTRFVTETDIDCVLVAGRYSLLERGAEDDLLPACVERQVGVIAGGVFNSGILAAPAAGANYNYGPAPEGVLHRVRALDARCSAYGVPLAAAALQFPLRHPGVTSVVVGARDANQVTQNAAHAATVIPEGLWDELDAALEGEW
ncbi:aldo/keto reductase [Streptomyces sp. NPDC051064]|uniref:aldo/keto reductase n=1 Tax=Streptomyces sp. NPDC051064 TaxID=3365641 RepID=UPI0037B70960